MNANELGQEGRKLKVTSKVTRVWEESGICGMFKLCSYGEFDDSRSVRIWRAKWPRRFYWDGRLGVRRFDGFFPTRWCQMQMLSTCGHVVWDMSTTTLLQQSGSLPLPTVLVSCVASSDCPFFLQQMHHHQGTHVCQCASRSLRCAAPLSPTFNSSSRSTKKLVSTYAEHMNLRAPRTSTLAPDSGFGASAMRISKVRWLQDASFFLNHRGLSGSKLTPRRLPCSRQSLTVQHLSIWAARSVLSVNLSRATPLL